MLPQYRYTGDIKKLIPNGWKFSLLYAHNYKAYNKGLIWMFVASKMMVEIDNIYHNKTIIDFILKNKNQEKDFWETIKDYGKIGKLTIPNWVCISDDEYHDYNIISYDENIVRKRKAFDANDYVLDGFLISYSFVNHILDLQKLGNLELCE
jgi:hypothetical protein